MQDISRIETGTYFSDWKFGDISIYTKMICETFFEELAKKAIRFSFYSEPGHIEADFVPYEWEIVIKNLLVKAIENTLKGDEISVFLR